MPYPQMGKFSSFYDRFYSLETSILYQTEPCHLRCSTHISFVICYYNCYFCKDGRGRGDGSCGGGGGGVGGDFSWDQKYTDAEET